MPNARLYTFVGGVVLGTHLSSLGTYTWQSVVFLCFCFVIFIVVSYFLSNRNYTKAPLIILFIALSVGVIRTEVWKHFNHTGNLDNLINIKKSVISGIVSEEPQRSDSSSKIIVETLTNTEKSVRPTKLLVTDNRYSIVNYGDELKLSGKVSVPKTLKSDEGDFAYDVYLARQGIFYTMAFPGVTVVTQHRASLIREYLITIKNNFLNKINQLFTSPKSGLLAGLLISGRSSLSKSEQTLFTQAGLIHIVALSGFNVTIIAQGLMMILIFLPKRIRLIIGAVGIIIFVTMAGFGSTIVRAGIMALLVIFSALTYRTYHVGRALFVAVLFMILWNPMVIFDVSFQLSCIATFAVIFAVNPAVEKYKNVFKFLPEKFKIRETVLGTAVIEIFLLPILLSTSGQISLVTVITNLLVLPVLPVVMGFGFVATMLGYIHFWLALPIVAISNIMLEYILLVTNIFANIPFGVFSFRIPQWCVLLMYLFIAFWLWRLQKFSSTQNVSTKNGASIGAPSLAPVLTSANLERLDNFFQSHSNSNSQKKL